MATAPTASLLAFLLLLGVDVRIGNAATTMSSSSVSASCSVEAAACAEDSQCEGCLESWDGDGTACVGRYDDIFEGSSASECEVGVDSLRGHGRRERE